MNSTSNQEYSIQDFLVSESKADLIEDIYQGLSKSQKQLSSRFFYNDEGSALFEEITKLPEYYPTRTEIQIIQKNAGTIIGEFEHTNIIELGSGDSSKISILLDAIPPYKLSNVSYIPVDVSEAAIFKSVDLLAYNYPGLKIKGLRADFMKHFNILPGERGKRLICFFGSTIGNLTRKQANEFLLKLINIMHPCDQLLLGLDMVKDENVLHNAYNDKQGITALFNKNILNAINETVETNFNTHDFEHHAFYSKKEARIEMHLIALKNLVIKSNNFPKDILITKGETLHTENSHKFTTSDIQYFATITGFRIKSIYTDKNQWFSLILFEK